MAIFRKTRKFATADQSKKVVALAAISMVLQAELDAAKPDSKLHRDGTIAPHTIHKQLTEIAGLSVGFTLEQLPEESQVRFWSLCDRLAEKLMQLKKLEDSDHYRKAMILTSALKTCIVQTRGSRSEAVDVLTFCVELIKQESVPYRDVNHGRKLALKILEWV